MTYIDPLAVRIKAIASDDVTLPEDTRLLFQMYALLARVKGTSVTLEDVHDAWVVWMLSKNEAHSSMIPFDSLDQETQREDQPFVNAIHQVARERQPD